MRGTSTASLACWLASMHTSTYLVHAFSWLCTYLSHAFRHISACIQPHIVSLLSRDWVCMLASPQAPRHILCMHSATYRHILCMHSATYRHVSLLSRCLRRCKHTDTVPRHESFLAPTHPSTHAHTHTTLHVRGISAERMCARCMSRFPVTLVTIAIMSETK